MFDSGKQKSDGIIALTNDSALPNVGWIQQMLKSSITRLKVPMFSLFQTILADFWALQSFAEPYRYEERLQKRFPLINGSTNDVDKTEEEEEISTHRKTIKKDMEMYRAAKKLLEKTKTSDTESISPGTDDDKSTSLLGSTFSSSSSSSSSDLQQSSLILNLMSPSILETPKEGKTVMSVKEIEISNMEIDHEIQSNKRKREASASTTTREQRNSRSKKQDC